MSRDVALGVILLAITGGYYRLARAIPESQLADAVGPAGLPTAYAAVLTVLAVALIVRSLRARPNADAAAPPVTSRTAMRVLGMLGLGVFYIAIVTWVGYPAAIGVLIVGTSYYQGGRMDRRVLSVGVLGALVLWVLFVLLLGVRQPEGAWTLTQLLGRSS